MNTPNPENPRFSPVQIAWLKSKQVELPDGSPESEKAFREQFKALFDAGSHMPGLSEEACAALAGDSTLAEFIASNPKTYLPEERAADDVSRLFVRFFNKEAGDFALIAGWIAAKTGAVATEDTMPLPPIVMLAESHGGPVAAGWVFFGEETPLAMLEGPFTKPGLHPEVEREAMLYLIQQLEGQCIFHKHELLVCYAELASAMWLEKYSGFHCGPHRVFLTKRLGDSSEPPVENRV